MSCTKCNCFFCQFINYSPHIPLLWPDLRILLALGTKVPKRVFHKQRRRQNAINFNVDMEYEEEEKTIIALTHTLWERTGDGAVLKWLPNMDNEEWSLDSPVHM